MLWLAVFVLMWWVRLCENVDDVYAFLGQRAKAVSFLRNNLFLWILFFSYILFCIFTHIDKADMFLVSSALVCIKCAMSCPGLFLVPLWNQIFCLMSNICNINQFHFHKKICILFIGHIPRPTSKTMPWLNDYKNSNYAFWNYRAFLLLYLCS